LAAEEAAAEAEETGVADLQVSTSDSRRINTYPEVMDRAEEAELPTAPEAEETALLAEETLEATAEDAEETEAPTPEAEEDMAMEVMETEDPAAEETEAEAPPEVTPAAPAAEVAEAFKQSVEEPAWMVTGEE